jgi:hypothetical protein
MSSFLVVLAVVALWALALAVDPDVGGFRRSHRRR